MRSEEIVYLRCRQLDKIVDQLLFGVAPGEVGVRLGKTDLRQPIHHLRSGEGFGQKDYVGMPGADLRDKPFPERQRLGVRIVDAKDADPLVRPEEHDVAQGGPEVRDGGLGVEIDIDDVFVFLRRVFRVPYRAVRPPIEPFGMLADPRMVRRALNREIERQFKAMFLRCIAQPAEVFNRTEFGMERVMSALAAADGVGAADFGWLAA